MSVGYNPWLESVAVESAPFGVLDPDQDVPFAVVWETQGTLTLLAEGEF